MESIPAHAKADELGIDRGAAAPRVFELLEHDRAASVGKHETVALKVPGTTRLLRSLVTGRERLRLPEATETARCRRHLTAAGQHPVGITVLNSPHAKTECMR